MHKVNRCTTMSGQKNILSVLDCNVNKIYTWKFQNNLEMPTKVLIWFISQLKPDYFHWSDDVLEFYLRGYNKKTMWIYEKHTLESVVSSGVQVMFFKVHGYNFGGFEVKFISVELGFHRYRRHIPRHELGFCKEHHWYPKIK